MECWASMGKGRIGTWRQAVIAVLSSFMILVAVAPFGGTSATAATAKPASGASTTTTTLPIPTLKAVPLSLTHGQSVPALLSRAVTLDSVGVDTSGVRAAIAITQEQLDRQAVTVRQLRLTAAQARQKANALFALAHNAAQAYTNLDAAVKQAVLFLYM